jgi:transcriptional regulator
VYTPKSFLETDRARLRSLIESHAFGTLIATDADGALEIAHLPFLFEPDAGPHGELLFHVARANRIWTLAAEGRPLTAVFNGPHGYVSPRWYERPSDSVPTWNYAAVHAHGRAKGPMDSTSLLSLLADLTAVYERGAPQPWSLAEVGPSRRDALLPQIVGMTLVIDRLEGKLKLSQNRSPADQERVARALEERGHPDDREMAHLMKSGEATNLPVRPVS